MSEKMKKLLLGGLLLLSVISIAQGVRNGLGFVDFHWESAALFLRGENPYQWFFDNRYFQGVYVDATQAPSTIAFILPYGLFSHYTGNMLWAVTNVLFLLVFFFFIWKVFFPDNGQMALFLAAVFAIGTPYRVCVGNGQHAMISMAYFAAAYWAMKQKKSFWIVGFLMAGSLFKYTFAVPLAFIFLFHRQWRALTVCAGIHLVLTTIMGWWTNTNPIELVLQSMKVGTTLNTAGGDADWAGLAHWFGVADVGGYSLAGYAVFGLLLFVCSFFGKHDSLLKLAMFAVIANVMFYHRVYDFVTLIFPMVYVVKNIADRTFSGRAIRYLTVATVFWTFIAVRLFKQDTMNIYMPTSFVLEHLLLIALLIKSFDGKRFNS